ncbi:MAG: MerR family transcriptional regulator [Lachnospiraceae bacterium]|nr:MerR family transcriptional regulator [Lachnospiraceae bacterium]
MEKMRYMISDASNLIQVESHVLRYWEEELELDIPRNEMGHRYYTEENIRQFEQIKRLKERGYQLKAIRMLIHNSSAEEPDRAAGGTVSPAAAESTSEDYEINLHMKPDDTEREESERPAHEAVSAQCSGIPAAQKESMREVREADSSARPDDYPARKEAVCAVPSAETAVTGQEQPSKLEQFQLMMNEIVKTAIAENNRALSMEIGEQVGEKVIKEMNYLMRDREEQEEERFRKLDEAIRSRQRRPGKEKRIFLRTSIHKAQEMS